MCERCHTGLIPGALHTLWEQRIDGGPGRSIREQEKAGRGIAGRRSCRSKGAQADGTREAQNSGGLPARPEPRLLFR